jgi:hypothetical protein
MLRCTSRVLVNSSGCKEPNHSSAFHAVRAPNRPPGSRRIGPGLPQNDRRGLPTHHSPSFGQFKVSRVLRFHAFLEQTLQPRRSRARRRPGATSLVRVCVASIARPAQGGQRPIPEHKACFYERFVRILQKNAYSQMMATVAGFGVIFGYRHAFQISLIPRRFI